MAHSTQIEEFAQFYFSLSKTQKEIWRYLHWFCSTYERVQPSHEHIAEKIGCARRTVIRAIKHFVKEGWLGAAKAFWKTCTYFIADWLKEVDLSKLSWKSLPQKEPDFTGNVTQNVTPIKELPKDILNVREGEGVQHTKIKEEEMPPEVRSLPLKQRDKELLSRYSSQVLRYAIEDAKSYGRLRHVRNWAALITSRCKFYVNKFSKK